MAEEGRLIPTAHLRWIKKTEAKAADMPIGRVLFYDEQRVLQQWHWRLLPFLLDNHNYVGNSQYGEWRDVPSVEEW